MASSSKTTYTTAISQATRLVQITDAKGNVLVRFWIDRQNAITLHKVLGVALKDWNRQITEVS